MTDKEYTVRGCTALIDALGGAMIRFIVVNTFFYVALDAGDAAAILGTAKIVHDLGSPFCLFPSGTLLLWTGAI